MIHFHFIVTIIMVISIATAINAAMPDNNQLDTARKALWLSSSDDINSKERLDNFSVIQSAADLLPPEDFRKYMDYAKNEPLKADEMEKNGILYYLTSSINNAIIDIRKTRVVSGVVIWHIYNMGYIIKTPSSTFAIDICMRDGDRIAEDIDFLLITHKHRDHISPELMDAMIKANKPVVTQWYPGSKIIEKAATLQFGDITVKTDIGDHHFEQPGQTDNMLMYRISCGKEKQSFTIYHSGDGNNAAKMQTDGNIDLYIYHVSVGLDINAAAKILNPNAFFPAHLLEMEHSPTPPNAWRWPFKTGISSAKSRSPKPAYILTWGERWAAPGTKTSDK